MAFLGIGLFAGLITIVLSLARDSALRKWVTEKGFEEAREFASFSCTPHPIYPWRFLLWIGLGMVVASLILLYAIDSLGIVVAALVVGMVLFLVYDFAGARVRTNLTIVQKGLLFDSSRGDLPRFFMPFSNIESVEETPTGVVMVLKSPKLANHLPLKCRSGAELCEKITAGLKSAR